MDSQSPHPILYWSLWPVTQDSGLSFLQKEKATCRQSWQVSEYRADRRIWLSSLSVFSQRTISQASGPSADPKHVLKRLSHHDRTLSVQSCVVFTNTELGNTELHTFMWVCWHSHHLACMRTTNFLSTQRTLNSTEFLLAERVYAILLKYWVPRYLIVCFCKAHLSSWGF